MGCFYGLARMVCGLCASSRLYGDTAFYVYYYKGAEEHGKRIYDLFRDGSRVWRAASADSAADWRGEVPACVFHLCGGVLLFLAALVIFKGKEFREEMHKKFHV